MNESQAQILNFIKFYRETVGISPTYRIMAEHMGMAIGSIQDATKVLIKLGYLTHIKGRAASFVPTNKEIE